MTSPEDLAGQVDRLLSLDAIRQLPPRYALAVDTRNLDDLVGLFIEDVRVGNGEQGRAAMKTWWEGVLSRFATSVHLVANHVIDFETPDRARGVVYCRAEHEIMGQWVVQDMQYWDAYERREGRWYFRRRKPMSWYASDILARPTGAEKLRWPDRPRAQTELPGAFASWDEFWSGRTDPS